MKTHVDDDMRTLSKFTARDFKPFGITKGFAIFLAKQGKWLRSEYWHNGWGSAWRDSPDFYETRDLKEFLSELSKNEIDDLKNKFSKYK